MNDHEATTAVLDQEHGSHQYLTFLLAEEVYAIDILKVREIRVWEHVTTIPNTAPFIKGVTNLRGNVVPIIDLRERFGLTPRPYGPHTVVIILAVEANDRERIMGIVVDGVNNVCHLTAGETTPPPDFCSVIHAEFITGFATVEGQMLILLDTDRLLNMEELHAVGKLQDDDAGEGIAGKSADPSGQESAK